MSKKPVEKKNRGNDRRHHKKKRRPESCLFDMSSVRHGGPRGLRRGRSINNADRHPFSIVGTVFVALKELLEPVGAPKTIFVGKKTTNFSMKLEEGSASLVATTLAKQARESVKGMEVFTIRAFEASAPGYGRVITTIGGNQLPAQYLVNRDWVDYSHQPTYTRLKECLIIEVLKKERMVKTTYVGLGARKAHSVEVHTNSVKLPLNDTLLRRFVMKGEVKLEEVINDFADLVCGTDENNYEWAKLVPAMVTAYLKALGEAEYFFHECPTVQETREELFERLRVAEEASAEAATEDEVMELTEADIVGSAEEPAKTSMEVTEPVSTTSGLGVMAAAFEDAEVKKAAAIERAVKAAKRKKGTIMNPLTGKRCKKAEYVQLAKDGFIDECGNVKKSVAA